MTPLKFMLREVLIVAITLVTILTVFCVVGVARAEAQTRYCADRSVITKKLEKDYGEEQLVISLTGDDKMFEIWGDLQTGDWTAFTTNALMVSCVVSSGVNFEFVIPPLEEEHFDG